MQPLNKNIHLLKNEGDIKVLRAYIEYAYEAIALENLLLLASITLSLMEMMEYALSGIEVKEYLEPMSFFEPFPSICFTYKGIKGVMAKGNSFSTNSITFLLDVYFKSEDDISSLIEQIKKEY